MARDDVEYVLYFQLISILKSPPSVFPSVVIGRISLSIPTESFATTNTETIHSNNYMIHIHINIYGMLITFSLNAGSRLENG